MHHDSTPNITCSHCGTPFYKKPGKIRHRNFCSTTCYRLHDLRKVVDNGDGTATVILTKGFVALIDTADAMTVGAHNWSTKVRRDGTAYAFRKRNGKTEYLHRFLLCDGHDLWVDHINHDTLDNRRSNLRFVTPAQNGWNSRPESGSNSPYKGVGKDGNQWVAAITVNGETIRLGRFNTDQEAARAYDEAAMKLQGEFAHLNFPSN